MIEAQKPSLDSAQAQVLCAVIRLSEYPNGWMTRSIHSFTHSRDCDWTEPTARVLLASEAKARQGNMAAQQQRQKTPHFWTNSAVRSPLRRE